MQRRQSSRGIAWGGSQLGRTGQRINSFIPRNGMRDGWQGSTCKVFMKSIFSSMESADIFQRRATVDGAIFTSIESYLDGDDLYRKDHAMYVQIHVLV